MYFFYIRRFPNIGVLVWQCLLDQCCQDVLVVVDAAQPADGQRLLQWLVGQVAETGPEYTAVYLPMAID